RRNNTKAECRVSNILDAKGLAQYEYEDISKRKKMGNTTTEENLQAEKRYWQRFFLTEELGGKALNNLIYGTNPFYSSSRGSRLSGRCWTGRDGTAPETRTPSARRTSGASL
ncbi:MAG: hypothetical protein ACKPKO_15240, partial [Candidatus Fonsibacter sp.]